jgi:subtilisin family serine protease
MSKDAKLHIENLENRLALTGAIVAFVDSGIDLNHKDLSENIWTNPSEKVDGIDNDNNGYIDDINGWDFANNDNIPQDDFYHGTHIAGIVDSVSKNTVTLMPLKFQNYQGLGYTGAAATAINYATKMKLRGHNIAAINLSWGGGTSSSLALYNAIKNASDAGIVVVIAAGNNSSDNDLLPRYPSSYKFNNTISVAGLNSNMTLAGYSNYGKNSVEIGAIGTAYSTLPGNNYGTISGTSMAAPNVSAAVAMLKNVNVNYGANQIKWAILSTAKMVAGLVDRVTYGYLDIQGAMGLNMVPKPDIIPIQPPQPIVVPIVESHAHVVSVNKHYVKTQTQDGAGRLTIKINNRVRYESDVSGYSSVAIKRWMTKRYNNVTVVFKSNLGKESIIYQGSLRAR